MIINRRHRVKARSVVAMGFFFSASLPLCLNITLGGENCMVVVLLTFLALRTQISAESEKKKSVIRITKISVHVRTS